MEGCEACEKVKPLDAHFDAIFDFLEDRGLDELSLELAMLRMDLHGATKHGHTRD